MSVFRLTPRVDQSLGRVRLRVRQFMTALGTADRGTDDVLRRALADDRKWLLVQRLSDYDRRHAFESYSRLVRHGYRDEDLLCAAILHDIGKAEERGRVRLIHRIIRVAGGHLSPGVVHRLASVERGWFRHGLYLVIHHAALGSEMARAAGCSERCCELIARHEEQLPTGDRLLDALIRADEGLLP